MELVIHLVYLVYLVLPSFFSSDAQLRPSSFFSSIFLGFLDFLGFFLRYGLRESLKHEPIKRKQKKVVVVVVVGCQKGMNKKEEEEDDEKEEQ